MNASSNEIKPKNYYGIYDLNSVDPALDNDMLAFAAKVGWNFPDGAELLRGFNGFAIRKQMACDKYQAAVVTLNFNGEVYYKDFKYLKPVTERRFIKDLKAWLKIVPSGSGKNIKWVHSFSAKP